MRIYERFRFRVYDVDKKEYWYDHCLIHGRDGSLVTENLDSGEFLEFDNPPILEQCTGMRDKYGELIYEWDIVKSDEDGKYYVVYWNNSLLQFELGNSKGVTAQTLNPSFVVAGNIRKSLCAK